MTSAEWAVRDKHTGATYPQPNKLIAEKVAEMHGASEVIPVSQRTADDRIAIVEALFPRYGLVSLPELADDLIGAGFRHFEPPTQAEVEAAAKVIFQNYVDEAWENATAAQRTWALGTARMILKDATA